MGWHCRTPPLASRPMCPTTRTWPPRLSQAFRPLRSRPRLQRPAQRTPRRGRAPWVACTRCDGRRTCCRQPPR
eukprot:3085822-Pyramimonas_sp.AAC.1